MTSEDVDRRPRQRGLREELGDAGVRLDLDRPTSRQTLDEITYGRFPRRHEGKLPTYGALVVSADVDVHGLGGVVVDGDGLALDTLRLMADGARSFVLAGECRRGLLMFATAYDRETEIAVPGCPRPMLDAILGFCVHDLGPAPTGAILVWNLTDRGEAAALGHVPHRQPALRLPELSLLDPSSHGAVRSLLGQLDGAVLLDRDAALVEAGLRLTFSEQAERAVTGDLVGGTRHASARRFSFDGRRHDRVRRVGGRLTDGVRAGCSDRSSRHLSLEGPDSARLGTARPRAEPRQGGS